jgi:hypothetical protein
VPRLIVSVPVVVNAVLMSIVQRFMIQRAGVFPTVTVTVSPG